MAKDKSVTLAFFRGDETLEEASRLDVLLIGKDFRYTSLTQAKKAQRNWGRKLEYSTSLFFGRAAKSEDALAIGLLIDQLLEDESPFEGLLCAVAKEAYVGGRLKGLVK